MSLLALLLALSQIMQRSESVPTDGGHCQPDVVNLPPGSMISHSCQVRWIGACLKNLSDIIKNIAARSFDSKVDVEELQEDSRWRSLYIVHPKTTRSIFILDEPERVLGDRKSKTSFGHSAGTKDADSRCCVLSKRWASSCTNWSRPWKIPGFPSICCMPRMFDMLSPFAFVEAE
jgi:hypothetical protein